MIFPSNLIEDAVNEFAKLPGIGKKTALRHVLHLLKKEESDVLKFTYALERMRKEIKFCMQCHNVADGNLCNICASATRKKDVICVVENIRDLLAIENTQQFNGTYHVLNGLIAPLDGIGPDQINIASLINRALHGDIVEIILALSPNLDGDTTSFYIQKELTNKSIAVTAISRGVAFGGDLEYTDEMTLARSLQNRLPINNLVR
jgi:recombination protein RecR